MTREDQQEYMGGIRNDRPRPDPDIKAGNAISRFMLFYRKVRDLIPDEPRHYNFLLTWEEAQALIDHLDGTLIGEVTTLMEGIPGKLSEQLLWQAEGPK